jgi:hypothetical protein
LLIFRDFDRFMVFRVKQLLEDSGIPCFIKNEFLSGAIGEVAPLDAQPEVWLSDDEWQLKAEQLIADFTSQSEQQRASGDWVCLNCGEANDASFVICWQCQTNRE